MRDRLFTGILRFNLCHYQPWGHPGQALRKFPHFLSFHALPSFQRFEILRQLSFSFLPGLFLFAASCLALQFPSVPWAAEHPAKGYQTDNKAQLAPVWANLAQRLARDGVTGPEVITLLRQLPSAPVQDPMGRKIRELYRSRFVPGARKKITSDTWYKGVVTEANAALCREYIREHEQAFLQAQAHYGVSPAIASALLFVETRLGKVLADVPENAFYILASMAVCDKPSDISQWLSRLPDYTKHMGWLEETLQKRSQWAYAEVRALIKHMIRDNIPPDRLPGSIYGAVGLCQFMPSNISTYGADGDGDGIVDLFNPPDAIASLACYLAKHGWKHGIDRSQQHRLLMTYNHSQVYANTILALSDLVEHRVHAQPAKGGKSRKRQ